MAVDPAERIAVLSTYPYRAESLALFLTQRLAVPSTPAPDPSAEALATFGTVLIDIDCGMSQALQLTDAITTVRPEVKVVFVGVVESTENVLQLAEVGAAGYVPSTANLEELSAAVESVLRGEFACPPHITYALFAHLAQLARCNVSYQSEASVLTTRERQVMDLLSRGLSNKEIAARLCLSGHTVKNHVHRILRKLGIRNRSYAARLYSPLFDLDYGKTLVSNEQERGQSGPIVHF